MLRTKLVPPLALLALLAGCADPAKRAAEEAIQGTEATLAAARADAAKFAPELLKPVDEGLATARETFAKGDFSAALAAARELPAKAKAVASTAAARREDLNHDFAAAGAQLPQLFEVIRNQLDALAAAKKLPKGMTPATLAKAREELAAVGKALDEATAKAVAGEVADAVRLARPLRARSLALAAAVGLELGGPPAK
jgi:hypothetical protein